MFGRFFAQLSKNMCEIGPKSEATAPAGQINVHLGAWLSGIFSGRLHGQGHWT